MPTSRQTVTADRVRLAIKEGGHVQTDRQPGFCRRRPLAESLIVEVILPPTAGPTPTSWPQPGRTGREPITMVGDPALPAFILVEDIGV